MRIRNVLISSTVSSILSIGLAPPAVAQSFFQKLFGTGGSSQAEPMARGPSRPIPSIRFHHRVPRYPVFRDSEGEDDMIGPPDSGGPYRTMCVRTCDGYYFPVRFNARRRNFSADVRSCRAACGADSKLFYHPVSSGSAETMVDLSGRRYADIPTAFAYRKMLMSGCACKPEPWSYEATERHREYAAAAEDAARVEAQRTAVLAQATVKTDAAEPKDEVAKAQEPVIRVADALPSATTPPGNVPAHQVQVIDTPVANAAVAVPVPAPETYQPIRSEAPAPASAIAVSNATRAPAPRATEAAMSALSTPAMAAAPADAAALGTSPSNTALQMAPESTTVRKRPTRTRAAMAAQTARKSARNKNAMASSGGGLFGGGQKTYVWPGD
ncbi:MAG: DUF2865 domain-containing protein [Hyphomicrobium sp.]